MSKFDELQDVAYAILFNESERMGDKGRCDLDGVAIEEQCEKCHELAEEFVKVYEEESKKYMSLPGNKWPEGKYTKDGPYFYPMLYRFIDKRLPEVFPVPRCFVEDDFDYDFHIAYAEFAHDAIELQSKGEIECDFGEDELCRTCWNLAIEFCTMLHDNKESYEGIAFFEAVEEFHVADRLKQIYPARRVFEVETDYKVSITRQVSAKNEKEAEQLVSHNELDWFELKSSNTHVSGPFVGSAKEKKGDK